MFPTKKSFDKKEQNISKFKIKYINNSIINLDINYIENSNDEKLEGYSLVFSYFIIIFVSSFYVGKQKT